MCRSGDVFNSTMEHWLESLMRAMLSPVDTEVEGVPEDARSELVMLCNLWLDHYLSPYHDHSPEHAEYAVMTVSDIVVLGRAGYDTDLWDKILGLAKLISDEHCQSNQQADALEFLTLVGLRLRAAQNRWAQRGGGKDGFGRMHLDGEGPGDRVA